jgi:hypothetical protein
VVRSEAWPGAPFIDAKGEGGDRTTEGQRQRH